MAKYITDFRKGDTKTIQINYGKGFDITGWTLWFTMRAEFADASPTAQVSTTPGDHSADDPANGLVHIVLDSTTSASIPAGKYYYDVQRSKPNGSDPVDIKTILPPIEDYKDQVEVVPGATVVAS